MYWGEIYSILSSDPVRGEELAAALGKRKEADGIGIYYRKDGEYIRSALLPLGYPDRILQTVEAATLSQDVVIYLPQALSWADGELALIADSSGARLFVSSELDPERISKVLGELAAFRKTAYTYIDVLRPPQPQRQSRPTDEGVTYVDRVFQVKGVGTVVTGFSFMRASVHQELVALPSGIHVEVRSIQVLDEDQEEVDVGVRVGYALKGATEDQLKGTYMLVRDGVEVFTELEGSFTGYRWSEPAGQLHAVCRGASIPAELRGGEGGKLSLSKPVPAVPRCTLVAANARKGRPRLIGYVDVGG